MAFALPTLFHADPDNPDEDPGLLTLFSAQNASIEGMEKAVSKDPRALFAGDSVLRMSALHVAAASCIPKAPDAVRWLLRKGLPWNGLDVYGFLPEDWARMHGKHESCTVLRNWAVDFEYRSYYGPGDDGKMFGLPSASNKAFCNSSIRYINPLGAPEDEVALVTGPEATGIMMEWERPVMRETARLLLDGMPTTGLRVLNIGFGIGMIDTYFQDAQPAEHVIIEGHPTCLRWMRDQGWYDRPGVRILEGRWQDLFPFESPADIGKFDIVYFDTFQEGYPGHFSFIKNVPGLLRGPGSRFSYFNGHGALTKVSNQVYMEVARLHHNDLGMNTEYFPVDLDPKTVWFTLKERDQGASARETECNIPICALAPTIPRQIRALCPRWENNHPDSEI